MNLHTKLDFKLKITYPFKAQILACGGQLKNTFCLAKHDFAYVSPNIGDLSSLEAFDAYKGGIEQLKRLIACEPEVVAYDLHPEYLSTKYALSIEAKEKIGVQHHYSHIVSCMVDNQVDVPLIGVAFDGTGFGEDGNIWGGEWLVADLKGYRRASHLQYISMPGGAQAIEEPWRMAASYLYYTYGDGFTELDIEFNKRLEKTKWSILKRMLERKINSPLSSSIGRLFDAVSSLVGIRDVIEYEAQAAIELEKCAVTSHEPRATSYEFEIKEENRVFVVDPGLIIVGVVEDLKNNIPSSIISSKFHNTIAEMIYKVCERIGESTGLRDVALSGGVFQNRLLLERTLQFLESADFTVYTHHNVPTNDGGISLGQAVAANQRVNGSASLTINPERSRRIG